MKLTPDQLQHGRELITVGSRVRMTAKVRHDLRSTGLQPVYRDRVGTVLEVRTGFCYGIVRGREGMHLTTKAQVKWDGEPAPHDDGVWVYVIDQLELADEKEGQG